MPADKLAELLTNTGLEVEGLEEFESIKGGLNGLVVGEVVQCRPHPNADKLSVTLVNVGDGDPLPIVCGAPNVATGQIVVVAQVGTWLHMGDDSFQIKKTKIRGEQSMGMICAEDEIGIGEDHEGIIVLDQDLTPGTPVSEVIEVMHDTVFEIGLTPNRIDGASHIGTARDVVAYLNQDDSTAQLHMPDVSSFKPDNTDLQIPVEVEDSEACPRYSGVTLSGIKVMDSPVWLQNKLKAIGQTPINNIVDITNFVLHETGQPLHAFDANQIKGNKVVIKTLPDGTLFKTLDDTERELTSRDLMICDVEEGLCIGGVFGGVSSGVNSNTSSIFLESACFNPVWIRKTAKHHGLNTDASFRFERGTDPNGTVYALKRAALLIKEIAGGAISSELVDLYPNPVKPYPVVLSWSNLDRLTGVQIPRETVRQILALLDFTIVTENSDQLNLEVATYRVDVTREVDVIEEILRIYGYNNIGISDQVQSTLSYAPSPDPELLENRIAEQLVSLGFHEMMANSLTKSSYYTNQEDELNPSVVRLLNPLSSDLGVMRQNLLFGGLEAVKLNASYKRNQLKVFEFGNTYALRDGGNPLTADGYIETRRLALFLTGNKFDEHWQVQNEANTFYTVKGVVNQIFTRLGFKANELGLQPIVNNDFKDGLTVSYRNKEVVVFGQVSQNRLNHFEIETPVFYASFNWDLLLRFHDGSVHYEDLPKYPEVRRDLALIIDENVSFTAIQDLAFHVERKLLKSVNLFDVFQSDKLGSGMKSYAVSFVLQDERKTLTDKQIEKVMKGLVSAFEQKLGAKLRS